VTTVNIKKLREICQRTKKDTQPGWYLLTRKISIYITWLFIKTPITANQVTVLSIFIGLLGGVMLFIDHPFMPLVATICLFVYHLLDKVDGEIARYHKKTSREGVYLDEIGHSLVFPVFFVVLGLRLYAETPNLVFPLLGFVTAFLFLFARNNKNAMCRIRHLKSSQKKHKGDLVSGGGITGLILNSLRVFVGVLENGLIIFFLFFVAALLDLFLGGNLILAVFLFYAGLFIVRTPYKILSAYLVEIHQ